MRPWIFYVVFSILTLVGLEASMKHLSAIPEDEWQEEGLPPFDELMLSWNASRPAEGKYLFYISVKTEGWSPWLLYASWANDGQSSFQRTAEGYPVRVYQDALEVLEGKKATGFRIKVMTESEAALSGIHGLHVYTNGDRVKEVPSLVSSSNLVHLKVPGISQMALDHLRNKHLCSPTSTTAVTRYLANNSSIDPISFAQRSWDQGFDIFGNWVFNVAEAATHLGSNWSCWVERLPSFDSIYQRLHQGTPVIVSVRGPLPGSAEPYAQGHLMAVVGYDPSNQKVICIDPAFPADSATEVSYDLSDFMDAWARRGNVAYVFSKK